LPRICRRQIIGGQLDAVAAECCREVGSAAHEEGRLGRSHQRRDARRRGCQLPGQAADLVVLDTDIVAHPERIAAAQVVATMVDGRWVHGAPPW
jgi:hypothetical protein